MSTYHEYYRRDIGEFGDVWDLYRSFVRDVCRLAEDAQEPDHLHRGLNLAQDGRESRIEWLPDIVADCRELVEDMGFGLEFSNGGYTIYGY